MSAARKNILGLSFGHGDSAAALIQDDQLIAAVEQERLNRVKHYAGFPEQAIKYCLDKAGLMPHQIDQIAIAKSPSRVRSLASMMQYPADFCFRVQRFWKHRGQQAYQFEQNSLDLSKVVYTEHHEAHAASVMDQIGGDAAILTFDGLGDFTSTAYWETDNYQLKNLGRLYFPDSLGYLYTAITQFLGYPHYGDEFKVMGLSSYGMPRYVDQLGQLVKLNKNGFKLNSDFFKPKILLKSFTIENQQPKINPMVDFIKLEALLGIKKPTNPLAPSQQQMDLAKSLQTVFELTANHLLKVLASKTGQRNLAVAGGCAHNSVWVGQVLKNSPFKSIVTPAACHDAGIAIGAARLANNRPISYKTEHPSLLGPDINSSEKFNPEDYPHFERSIDNQKELIEFITSKVIDQKILGLYQGRLEFGPRALGNRSIIADPRSNQMKEILNTRVKHREWFRPFAASVLKDQQHHWFENTYDAPNMEAVFVVKPSCRPLIPAVVHHDQTCRIQSVSQKSQPFYWNLIYDFYQRTGVPMLINTSFNDSEPIVASPQDAYRCFANTEMDYLIIESFVFSKNSASKATHGNLT
jgi:carbamoyltransferase